VLEYLHVPHDLPLAPQRQVLLAQSKIKDKDLDDDTPDHPGEPLETAEVNTGTLESARLSAVARRSKPVSAVGRGTVVEAAVREPLPPAPSGDSSNTIPPAGAETKLPASGTVVLDVEQGGIEVPSFVGKTFRRAIETAQDVGLQLDAVGSGLARQQSPAAGTHVPAGSRVTVQFGR
jgi:cell division protein FtsI (penicillin-binding protein 3)